MSVSQDRLLSALAHAGLAVGPRRPVDTARFVAALGQHGFEFVPPQHLGPPHWLEATVNDLVREGWGWSIDGQPQPSTFDAHAALAELRAEGTVVRHVDDPTEEDLQIRGVSDEALRREILRRGLAFEDYEPTTGPTP